MEDLSDYIKRHYLGYHKKPEDSVKDRVVKMNEHRKNDRHDQMYENRNIPENISPYVTPKEKRAKQSEKVEPKPEPVCKRWEKLQKWKAEKEKKKQIEKKKEKPLFKVCHVPINIGLPRLENVNCEIKGKSFKSKFAPANHEFKPPSNIKPINFQYNKTIKEKTTNTTKNENTKHQMTTRSQARKVTQEPKSKIPPKAAATKTRQKKISSQSSTENKKITKKTEEIKETKTKDVKIKNKKTLETDNTKTEVEVVEETKNEIIEEKATLPETPNNSLISPDYPVMSDIQSSESDDHKTPQKTTPPVYISPFVTISRGKNSARKEYEARKMGTFNEKSNTSNCTSPRAGAAYFSWLLSNQITRLQNMCEHWNKYKDEETLPEEAVSMIDVAVGQTNLLLTKKFMQFQGLIDACNQGGTDKPVTCEDLHGFWDMIHIQIDNLNKRFDNLENLKQNNWQEILPEIKKVVSKKTKVVKNVKASAGLRAAIEAARRKKIAEPKTDEISIQTKTPQNKRVSNRLVTEERKSRKSSPGLMMMKVAQFAKNVDTPAKSILKTETHKSARSQSKVVIFQDELDISVADLENLENDANIINSETKGKTPPRRSRRLSKVKLF